MGTYETHQIRNIAMVGHAGAGKTTLVEELLHAAGAIGAVGTIERGTTVCDYDPLEREHSHSLGSALVSLEHDGLHVNIIDTPGYLDFLGEALSVLPAVETAAVVINAQAGIEPVTQRMMERALERKLCRLVVINRIDGEETNLPELLSSLRQAFGNECLPINLPAKGGTAVVDCFFNPSGESDFATVEQAHREIVDQVVELDDKLMQTYLEQGEVKPEELHGAFERALREGHLVPVCFTSAKTGAGVKELLDIFARLMPNPTEGNPRPFVSGEGAEAQEIYPEPDPSKHVLAHVFKIVNDPFMGRIASFRIHQGTVTKDSQLFVGSGKKPLKVGHLYRLQGKEHIEMPSAIPGDICALAKVDDLNRDDVLHDSHDEDDMRKLPMSYPQPMFGLAVEAKSKSDEGKISQSLAKLAAEDPCFLVERHTDTHELVIRGLGELHLRVMLAKLDQRYHVQVNTRPPRIAYRETITKKAEGHCRHKKQTGGAGQFGEVYLKVEPLARGEGFAFANEVFGGAIPTQYIPAVEKGVRQALEAGAIAGYPLQDVKVIVYDGKYHPVDSKEIAFVTAGKKAFLDAIRKAGPVVLEPLVNLQVQVPSQSMGDIAGDMSSRRGRINSTNTRGDQVEINALVPENELGDYQSFLKSATAGRGSYMMELSHYEAVPPQVQQRLIAEHKPVVEED